MTVPNLITTLRIILAPIFVIYLINDQFISSLTVFAICGVSDGVDGLVARLFNQKSRIGTFLDPIADKIVLVSAFIGLAVKDLLPAWLAVLVISRDVMILLGVFMLFLNGMKLTIRPSFISKITTCLQFITVIIAFIIHYQSFLLYFYPYLIYLTGLVTIISGLHYLHSGFRMMGEGAGDVKEEKI